MDIFSKRPLFLALTLFLFISVFCCDLTGKAKRSLFWICLSLTILFLTAAILSAKFYRTVLLLTLRLLLCAAFCTAAAVSSLSFFENTLYPLEHTESPVLLEGEILEKNFSASYLSTYTVKIKRLDEKDCSFKAILEFDAEPELAAGDLVRAVALLYPFEESIMRAASIFPMES